MLYFMRHGENEDNLAQVLSARQEDKPLTEMGMRQAEAAADWLAGRSIRRIYSSSLKRAQQSAQIVARRLGLDVMLSDDIRELYFGALEGRRYDEIGPIFMNVITRWMSRDLTAGFEDGENGFQAVERFTRFVHSLPDEDGDALVVGHHGIFMIGMAALSSDLNSENTNHFQLHNGAIVIMNRTPDGLSLVQWDVSEYLEQVAMDSSM